MKILRAPQTIEPKKRRPPPPTSLAGVCSRSSQPGAPTAGLSLETILTFFEHRLTNGPVEGLNNKIQGLVKQASGYRNKVRFQADIFYYLNGLDPYPAQ